MIKLDSGNVLLKPSHRRKLLARLRRTLRIGDRLGSFVLTIRMQRVGRCFEVDADVHDRVGQFHCRVRQSTWRSALRELVRKLCTRLHEQRLQAAYA
jgi:ribosome-associated translation inhibitor RaiA